MVEERSYWLGFSVFPGIGPKRFSSLLKHFGTAQNAWNADNSDLTEVLGQALSSKFGKFREVFDLKQYARALLRKKVSFITLQDKDYPILLKAAADAPFGLYVLGDAGELEQVRNDKFIAVVGTRKVTSYGTMVTEKITTDLVSAGFSIISGLAYGVDSIAHRTSLAAGGKTIAVLGCGVDCCFPRENLNLYNQIIESGSCIISEYPLGVQPTKGSFPSRNRIIAGLSQGVILTEGAEDSGALYTAAEALKLNRPVFAVPGPITSTLSKGPHKLIAKGAKLVTGTEDILRELNVYSDLSGDERGGLGLKNHTVKGDTADEQVVIELLQKENMHFDELVRLTKISAGELGTVLSMMEMKGKIKSNSGIFMIRGD